MFAVPDSSDGPRQYHMDLKGGSAVNYRVLDGASYQNYYRGTASGSDSVDIDRLYHLLLLWVLQIF